MTYAVQVKERQLPSKPVLDFEPKFMGFGPLVVSRQRVGNWWLEPLTPETELPPRAAHRLEQYLQLGVPIRDVGIFHEIDKRERVTGKDKVVTAANRFRTQTVPVWKARLESWGKEYGPVLLTILKWGGLVLAACVAAAVMVVVGVGMLAGAALAADPILVVIHEDGAWVEIDRWR